MQLHEKYRPRSFSEVVAQPKAVKVIERFIATGELGGRAYWLSGKSGTGKTTIARLIAAAIAADVATFELDSTGLSAAQITDLERMTAGYALGDDNRKGWAIIVNEAHGLNRAAIRQLLTTLERVPGHVVWIFTTTCDGQETLFDEQIDAHPLLSRCVELPLSQRGLCEPLAEYVRNAAMAEGLDGQPIEVYVKAMKECGNNTRKLFQRVERGDFLV